MEEMQKATVAFQRLASLHGVSEAFMDKLEHDYLDAVRAIGRGQDGLAAIILDGIAKKAEWFCEWSQEMAPTPSQRLMDAEFALARSVRKEKPVAPVDGPTWTHEACGEEFHDGDSYANHLKKCPLQMGAGGGRLCSICLKIIPTDSILESWGMPDTVFVGHPECMRLAYKEKAVEMLMKGQAPADPIDQTIFQDAEARGVIVRKPDGTWTLGQEITAVTSADKAPPKKTPRKPRGRPKKEPEKAPDAKEAAPAPTPPVVSETAPQTTLPG